AEPERIIYSPSYFPAISPDEKYIAYEHRGEVLITDLETRETVATWRLPILPVYYDAAWRRPMPTDYEPIPIEWSPTGRELSIGTELTAFGFWIYNLDTGTASRVLPGVVIWGRWSRDGKKMLLVIGNPMWEIWEADIDPNRPTVESLGPGMSKQEHCRDMIAEMEDWLVGWPKGTRATLSGRLGAFCHAGLGHEDEVVTGLDKWLRSLSTWPETQPPTYWQMANCVLDCYDPGTDDGNAALSLAAKVAELAQDSWAGEVLAGMAHYRAGAYEDAMAHLEHAEQLRGQSGADLYPDQVAYTAMTLNQLGRRQEAEDALERLRDMFLHNTSHDDFQPLVNAEKVFTEENRLLPTVWDHIEQGYLDKALELLVPARESVQPSDSEVDAVTMSAQRQLALRFAALGQWYEQRGEYSRAANEFESAAAAAPWHTEMLNLLARFHAICPEAEFRDGTSALQNATKACELSNWDNYNYIDTLAAACAEAGRFEQAVKWQSQAITKLPKDMRPGLRAQYEAKLRLYQEGQSYHGQYLLTGKLIARYSFDDISGNTVPDSSRNKIDGTLFGDARVIDDPVRGKVLELDGDGDGVDCGNDLLFGITEEITISSWIKVKGPVENLRTIIAKGTSWKLHSWPNTLKFVCGVNVPGDIGVDSGVLGKKAVNDGRWHHVAGVYDGRTATLYIDGQRDVSAAVVGSIAANSYNVWIGSDSHRNERAWKGRIDDVRIYSYVLSEDKIRELYAGNEPTP
ncbi:MAG: hypothetical protein KAV87_40755, partial [Desulfobacteraceae bacterium]|nr:hypothetical protein [Desulfobacteraceae bacterium]